jgi:hypothetical protein
MATKQRTKAAARTSRSRNVMPIIIRNTPPGYDWGWYSREEPRMHLQSTDGEHVYKVWLEERGRRVFHPVGTIPRKVQKALQEEVADHRTFVEDKWVRMMIDKKWIELRFAAPVAVLVVYPNTPNRFVRTVDLSEHFPGAIDRIMQLTATDVRLSVAKASLEVWPQLPEEDRWDIRLSTEIWQG